MIEIAKVLGIVKVTRFPSLSNEKKNIVQFNATSCDNDSLNQGDATGLESIPSSLILNVPVSVLDPPSVPIPLSALAPVPVPISVSVLDATAITDDDINGDKSSSTSAHNRGEIPCNSEGTIPLLEPMFR